MRITHAQIRAAMTVREDWDFEQWDLPINQPQLAGTQLLFGLVGLLGLRSMGFRFTRKETEAVLHLWRYVGHLMGVDHRLLPANEVDAWRLLWLIASTEFAPDDDSRALAVALSQALPPLHGIRGDSRAARAASSAVIGYHSAMSRLVRGGANGDTLGLPKRRAFTAAVVMTAAVTYGAETARKFVPGATGLAVRAGASSRRVAIEKLMAPLGPNRTYRRETPAERAVAEPAPTVKPAAPALK